MVVITRNLDASKFRVITSFSDWLDADRCGRAMTERKGTRWFDSEITPKDPSGYFL
jgi:hypothetical protein